MDSPSNLIPAADLEFGKRVSRTNVQRVPLSVEQFWSAFDDYLHLQKVFGGHQDTELEPGPINDVGAIIRFEFMGSITRERLVVKDSQNHIWKIDIPEPNALFSFYEATVKVYDTGDGTEVSLTMEVVMLSENREERAKALSILEKYLPTRIPELSNFVLQRDGLRCLFEFDVHYPIAKLWAVIGNWQDVSWVQYATGVKMGANNIRQIIFPKGVLDESLVHISDAERKLVYEVTKSAMPVKLYRGTVQLFEVNNAVTKVRYDNVFLPVDGQNPQQVKEGIEKSFNLRFDWFKSKFDTRNGEKMATGASVTGIVRAPINKVWESFRPFGPEIRQWWPIYEWLRLEAPGKDEVGAVRSFKTNTGREYKERLEARDDQNHIYKYSLLESNPSIPSLTSIVTTIKMSAKSPTETIIDWSAEINVDQTFAGQIVTAQEKAYTDAIKALDKHFHPSFGQLEVELLNGIDLVKTNLFQPDPYVILNLDEGKPQKSKVCPRTHNPSWNQKFLFDVLSTAGKLHLSVWDANVGQDNFMGSAEVDLHELVSGKPIRKQLALQRTDRGEIVVSLLLNLDSGEKLPLIKEVPQEPVLAFIEHLQDEIKTQLLQIMKQRLSGEDQKYEYEKYPRRKDAPDLPMEELPRLVRGLPPGQALPPKKLGLLSERIAEYVYSEIGFIGRLQQSKQSGSDPWTAYYSNSVQAPINIPQNWKDDVEFCRQLIQGVNPMCITLCTDQNAIPKEMANLTAQGKTIPQLISEKRLFMLDYADLEDIPQLHGKVFYPAFVLVYRELLEGGKSRLNLVGIQLTRHKDRKNEVYTPNSPYPNKYLLAKIHAACADDQYHQFTIHLGFAHLAVEPFAISHHNAFPKDHPIGQLLKPHFQDTIGINYMARQTLVSNVAPFTDRTFATGTAGGINLFLKAWKKWDFFGMSFPQQLLSRGFDEQGSDGVEDFFFREDGYKIWNAYTDYVSSVVAAVYKDDAAVKADPVIQAWAAETADPERGAVPGFPAKIETQELLVNTLTNIIFLASAQHSAINFSQYQALGYVPNRPNVLYKGLPETEGDISMEYVFSALQPFATAHFQVFFSRLLSTESLHPISELPLGNNLFPDLHAIFMAKLNLIAVEIEERNKKLLSEGKVPYPYLSPKQIASSVDI
ncbi:SRPBCC family protein [Tolypothrix sp. FACHB-123]|uniref:lipoxygenase family protein n=1 Tax=Tolypothrix sp. FACHB-123 TaxID=2692868 RepID=UPI001681F705|nr:lipoxygenase family protein [Tolypothrix sp. FACHB-123]MBD2354181.1 SRPBCC family protein [Tolypothrix sp. FACHB-123]